MALAKPGACVRLDSLCVAHLAVAYPTVASPTMARPIVNSNNDDVDEMVSVFSDSLLDAVNISSKQLVKRVKQVCQPPWLTTEIKTFIRKCDNYKFNKDYVNYKMCRNAIKNND